MFVGGNRTRTAVAGLSAAVVALAAATSFAASDKPLRLTHVVVPKSLTSGGPHGKETMTWTGNAVFPVVAHIAPRSCPPGLICNPVNKTFFAREDPFVWSPWVCEGTVPAGFEFRYYTWLTDAAGAKTNKVAVNVPCVNG
jgi:hypothetical protein